MTFFIIIEEKIYILIMVYFVWIIKATNIALNKSAKQSSTLQWGSFERWKPSLAIDGNTAQRSTVYGMVGVCTHTEMPPLQNEWWVVNLEDIFDIFSIEIYGRDDCCFDRLQDFDVDVIMPSNKSILLTLDTFDKGVVTYNYYVSNATGGNTYIKICVGGTRGQFVRIRHRGKKVLTLCEVEIQDELSKLSVEKSSHHRGFPGQRYEGEMIDTLRVKSTIQCMALCRNVYCCYAANFNAKTGECLLSKRSDTVTHRQFITNTNWKVFLLY